MWGKQIGDRVDACLHSAKVRAEGKAARRERLEKDQRSGFLHDRWKDAGVAAREEMLQLLMREIAGEYHPIAADVLFGRLEVRVEFAATLQVLKERLHLAE